METRFFNRELSWLEFNNRVLTQALRKDLPLLERLQFLSIVSSNFDEFFQVRVASVKRTLFSNPEFQDPSGLTPRMQLSAISARAHQIVKLQQECLSKDVLPELAKKGFVYVNQDIYSPMQKEYLQNLFRTNIFPLLTPLRTSEENFPHIKNLSLYAAFLLEPIAGIKNQNIPDELSGLSEKNKIAFVEIPSILPSVYWLPAGTSKDRQFTLISDIITECGTQLFPGLEVTESLIFKVARDADFAVDEDAGNNFIHAMEDVLIQRKKPFPVQMTCSDGSEFLQKYLTEKLELHSDDIYKVERFVNPGLFMDLRNVEEIENLSFEKWEHFYPADLPEDEPLWEAIKLHDRILHVPYQCYDPVVKMISDAAEDDKVLAIKMTLYRTGHDSPIIKALETAAQRGKQVTVLVELKARFDEERNIAWANELEQAGVTVIYGLKNLKVHAKILMVIRKESDAIRRYVHLSTGNYNPKTAKLYSDLSLFTENPLIANDATAFFNLVSGYSTIQKMDYLGMAPVTIKSRLLDMIDREIERSTKENPGLIIAKMNSLTHEEIIEALYKASQAGVKVLLNIRGICMLVPGIKGLSENIQVVSIVDRYLEHSRIFYFQNGGASELYCSSADWMSRNLDRRIELMFPILDPDCFADVKSILDTYFEDNTNAQILTSNGSWIPVEKNKKDETVQAQEILYKKYKKQDENKSRNATVQFEVRRK